tara:strand:- start:2960 stop:3961 length:1002 start_codon:yes stop_codon:yes gene_type:complete
MHNITERDAQVGLSQAWHGLTDVVETIDVKDNVLTKWDVERKPLTYVNVDGNEQEIGYGILVGSDDDKIIGRPMTPSYKAISNEKFLDLVSDAMAKLPKAKIESVGSVCNRGKVFVTVSLDGKSNYKVGDREFNDYLNFGNAHDQTSKLWINNTNTCTVCDNTFTYNLNNKSAMVGSAVHRGDIELKLADLSNVVDDFLGTQEEFRVKFTGLLKKKITDKKAQSLFTGFLMRNNPKEGLSTRCLNTVDSLNSLFKRGAGNRGENYADAFSAVTDYYTHNSTRGKGKSRLNQYVSSEFGLGRMNKQSFWTVVNNNELAERTIERGTKLLSLVNQ